MSLNELNRAAEMDGPTKGPRIVTTSDALFFAKAVEVMRAASEHYAPDADVFDQHRKLREEVDEVSEACAEKDEFAAVEECADVVIAATRLGTMLSPNFAKVLAAKCQTLHERAECRN